MGEVAPVVVHVTSSDGTRIGAHRSGAGPPLVLLHGATGAHWSFRYILPSLVERFTLYAVDRRGRGESGDAAEYAIEREFEDVAAIVDSLGEPASVFGHSYGATVALGAVLATPNIAKLVVYEASPGISVVPHEYLERIEELVEGGEREKALVYALGLFGLTPTRWSSCAQRPRGRCGSRPRTPSRARCAPRRPTCSSPSGSADVAAPALLLLGGESPDWAREGTERIREALPDARVAVLPGEGHAAIMTAPELVADEVTRFLAS